LRDFFDELDAWVLGDGDVVGHCAEFRLFLGADDSRRAGESSLVDTIHLLLSVECDCRSAKSGIFRCKVKKSYSPLADEAGVHSMRSGSSVFLCGAVVLLALGLLSLAILFLVGVS
jgi:hypothetical protein